MRFKKPIKNKILKNRAGEQFSVYQKEQKYERSFSFRKKKRGDIEQHFDKYIAPRVKTWVKSTKNRGHLHLIRIKLSHNLRSKRIKGGFSLPRTSIFTERGLRLYLKNFKKRFIKSLEKYLTRKDYRSITLKAIKFEVVIKRAKSAKKGWKFVRNKRTTTFKNKRRTKAKAISRHRHRKH